MSPIPNMLKKLFLHFYFKLFWHRQQNEMLHQLHHEFVSQTCITCHKLQITTKIKVNKLKKIATFNNIKKKIMYLKLTLTPPQMWVQNMSPFHQEIINASLDSPIVESNSTSGATIHPLVSTITIRWICSLINPSIII